MREIFKIIENSNQNDKNFDEFELNAVGLKKDYSLENVFGDLTFNRFYGYGIKKISTNTFSQTADKLTSFECLSCSLINLPPNYDIYSMIKQMTKLQRLELGLNATEIQPIGGQQSQIRHLEIRSDKNLTVLTGAFQNLSQLESIYFNSKIKLIEPEAFKFDLKSGKKLTITFGHYVLTSTSFQIGAFDGTQRNMEITFYTNLDYLADSVFKPFFDNKNNTISLGNNRNFNCSDCRNYWLIKENKQNQVTSSYCRDQSPSKLFDEEIKNKLKQKCTSNFTISQN